MSSRTTSLRQYLGKGVLVGFIVSVGVLCLSLQEQHPAIYVFLQALLVAKLNKVVEGPTNGEHLAWALAAASQVTWGAESTDTWHVLLKRCIEGRPP